MAIFALQVVLGLAFIVGPVVWSFLSDGPRYGEEPRSPLPKIISAFIGIILIVTAFGWTQIDPGWVGVVATQGRVEDNELQPGLSWRMPFITNVTEVDTRTLVYNFAGIEAFTLEQQPAMLAGTVQYSIQPDRASDLVQTVGTDYVNKLIVPLADERLKENSRQFRTDQITSERTRLGSMTLEDLRLALEESPVDIDGVIIQNVGLSEEYLAAVEKRQHATIEQERSVIEAQTARERATGEADSQRIAAKGQADANAIITESLTPELIQWQAVNKLNPNVNVMMVPADQGVLINMDAPTPVAEEE